MAEDGIFSESLLGFFEKEMKTERVSGMMPYLRIMMGVVRVREGQAEKINRVLRVMAQCLS